MIVALPVATAVTSPPLTVATEVLLDCHVAELVTSCVLLFERVACAVSCCVCPEVSESEEGVTVTLFTVWLLTVSPVLATTLPDLAVMVVVPKVVPAVASPAVLMLAMFVADDVQVTVLVASPVVLLPKVAVAVYCWVPFGKTTVFRGDIVSETIWSAGGKNCPHPGRNSNTAIASEQGTHRRENLRDTSLILPPQMTLQLRR